MGNPDAHGRAWSRRAVVATGGLATALATLEMVGKGAWAPKRVAAEAGAALALPDIQFDIGNFIAPVQTIDGIQVQFGPVNTVFATARLNRTPTRRDRQRLIFALSALEANYPFSSNGVFTFLSYGIPYFRRLPGSLVSRAVPRLRGDTSRFVLEEAVPAPTDVSARNPGITKVRFNVPVRIESNDLLVTLRSDNTSFLQDVLRWFGGSNTLRGQAALSPFASGLVTFTSSRAMFAQIGLPRFVAARNSLPFTQFINPRSPMWMGFADQQVDASGPAPICTFAGNSSARLTTAQRGSYFDNGSIQHLSHVILDMLQFFDMADENAEPADDAIFLERVQYMFHSPPPSRGFEDQLTDGGGPAFLPNENLGPDQARRSASGEGTDENEHRFGHLSALQRSSRAADGTPIHLRMDGPGFDRMDVPSGRNEPKLQFTVFVPSAEFFERMRRNQASLDLQEEFDVEVAENGLERFLTTTRRQNFLAPPRRNRAFPLVEFT